MNMPSLTARRSSSAVWTGEDRAAAWRKHVTDDQMRRAVEIFEMFGLDGIYSDAPMPCPEAAFEIMRSAAAARPAPQAAVSSGRTRGWHLRNQPRLSQSRARRSSTPQLDYPSR
jgi:hypothetical protein